MKNKILDLIKSKPKHYSQLIKRDTEMLSWVNDNSATESRSFPERIHQSLTGEALHCPRGNKKQFKSIQSGYGFCGTSAKCACCKASVSSNVAITKSKETDAQKKEATKKRTETTLKKYGVTNNGQTTTAISKHKEFYKNDKNTRAVSDKIKKTKLREHGDSSYNNRPKATQTCLKKYGKENVMQDPATSRKSAKTKRKKFIRDDNIKLTYATVMENIEKRFNLRVLVDINDYVGVISRPEWTFACLTCDHVFKKRYDAGSYPVCRVCTPATNSYKSRPELEILSLIKAHYSGKIISGDRTLISPFEIDIYLPDKKLAIEFCGLYWHSELSSGKNYMYHYNKYKRLHDKDIQLLTIFSDEYADRKEATQNAILSKIGALNASCYGRETTVANISQTISNKFLDKYHLQGATKTARVNVGLTYNGELVAVNSFRRTKGTEYELARFASSMRVVGGASKLLTHFIATYSPSQITTFSDNRWSDGNLYNVLGFTASSVVPPMQYYVEGYSKRHHKLTFMKQKLVKAGYSESNTEWQILQNLGYDRIWDCGKQKYVMLL